VAPYTNAMNLTYERGDVARPVGHALLYFTTGSPERVLATYLIVPPISMNLARYMPPMFAANLPMGGLEGNRPVPLPPVPEEAPGRAYLQRLAEVRGDDLIYGGTVLDDEPQRLLLETGYAAETYATGYQNYTADLLTVEGAAATPELDAAVAVYSAMGEGQRLAELTKLTGTLRDSTERGDTRGVAEASREMRALIETLPAKYRGAHLLAAAQEPAERGRRLCQLLLERAYAMHREEYLELGRIDREIEALDTSNDGDHNPNTDTPSRT